MITTVHFYIITCFNWSRWSQSQRGRVGQIWRDYWGQHDVTVCDRGREGLKLPKRHDILLNDPLTKNAGDIGVAERYSTSTEVWDHDLLCLW